MGPSKYVSPSSGTNIPIFIGFPKSSFFGFGTLGSLSLNAFDGKYSFLSLPYDEETDGIDKYENYICLEREAQNKYIVSHWNCLINSTTSIPKRVKAWNIKNDIPKKILKEFVERMKFLKGE